MILKLRQPSWLGSSNHLLPQPLTEDNLSLNSLHQNVPSTALISGRTSPAPELPNDTCPLKHRASLIIETSCSNIDEHSKFTEIHDDDLALALPLISADDTNGIVQSGVCAFSNHTPGQFGLTKQLVLQIALPHITLLAVSILYAVIGSGILTFINHNDTSALAATELIVNTKLLYFKRLMSIYDNKKAALANILINTGQDSLNLEIFNPSNSFDMEQFKAIENMVEEQWFFEFVEELNGIYNHYSKAGPIIRNVNTSIGYGTNAPETVIGRVFCLIYISLGIPLYLITLADLAKFCTEGMNRIYTEFLKYKYQIMRRYRRWRKNSRFRSNSVRVGEVIIAGKEDEIAEFIWTHLENTQFVEIPFLLIYGLLLAYVCTASYAIAWMEDWSIYNAFYFFCSSVLTIGFGDLVPSNDRFVLVTLCLVLFGLVLTTTCVDIVGAYYIDQLHFFGRRLNSEDPLIWLKAVQQKRIIAMKRKAMRKLFETVMALHHMRFGGFPKIQESTANLTRKANDYCYPEPPNPPRNIVAFNATAESVCLKWEAPIFMEEGRRYWYTLTFKTRTPQKRNHLVVIDFITTNHYEVTNLKTFTLYEFSLATTTRFGSSNVIKTQEYTEPCTVPTSLVIDAVSSETATIAWRAPKKNKGVESYVVQFVAESAAPLKYWQRYKVGKTKCFTITDLSPDTNYIACVLAEHNVGLAAMSKSIRFKTRSWFYDEEIFNPRMHMLSLIPPALYTIGLLASR